MTEKEIDDLSKPITIKELMGTQKLSTKKSPEPISLTLKFSKMIKEELPSVLLKSPQKVKKGIVLKSFCGASITLIPKPDKVIMKKQP